MSQLSSGRCTSFAVAFGIRCRDPRAA
jgi:hypothetical protein